MGDVWRYYRARIALAWRRSFDLADNKLSTVSGGIIFTLGAYLMIGDQPAFARPHFAPWFRYLAFSLATACIGIFVFRFIFVAPYRLHQDAMRGKFEAESKIAEYEKPALEGAIRVTCEWSSPPTHMLPDQALHVLNILHPYKISGGFVGGLSPSRFKLSSELIDWGSLSNAAFYRCEIENIGEVMAIDVEIDIEIVWKEVVVQGTGSRSGDVVGVQRYKTSPISVGPPSSRKYYFYIVNQSHHYVELRFCGTEASTPTISERRTFRLMSQDRMPFVHFGPPVAAFISPTTPTP